VCRRELVPNGPPRAGRRPAASAAPQDKAEKRNSPLMAEVTIHDNGEGTVCR
jgi:hypothetical protein